MHCTTAGVRLTCENSRSGKLYEEHSCIIHYLEQIQSPNPEIIETVTLSRFLDILFNFGEEEGKSTREKRDRGLFGRKRSHDASAVEHPSAVATVKRSSAHVTSGEGDNCPTALAAKSYYFILREEDPFFKSSYEVLRKKIQLLLKFVLQREVTEKIKRERLLFPSSLWQSSSMRYQIIFKDYEPFYFREIRTSFGISDSEYIDEFMTAVKARLVEGGASGAFFFFSKNEKFIAKSCTATEVANIRKSAPLYYDYMKENRNSCICRIYGVYMLQIYGTPLSFYVMNNLFLNSRNESINEKYDIKGSHVNRNASIPKDGQRVLCKHCNQKYIYISRYKDGKKRRRRFNDEGTYPPPPSFLSIEELTLAPMKRKSRESKVVISVHPVREV